MTRGVERNLITQFVKNGMGRRHTDAKERRIEKDRPLAKNEAASFFAASFKHSQGSQELQWKFFLLAHALHPHWEFPDETVQVEMQKAAIQQYTALVNHGEHKDVRIDPRSETKMQMENMQAIFAIVPEPVDLLVKDIFERIVVKDYEYLVARRDGRPHTDKKGKYQSYVMDYIAGRKIRSAGIGVFDEFFDLMRDYYNQGEWKKDADLQDKVGMVRKTHRSRQRKRFIDNILQKVGIHKPPVVEHRRGV